MQRWFDTSAFVPAYLAPFQRDGATYAFPKDSSMLGMQTNDQMLTDAQVSDLTEYVVALSEVAAVPMADGYFWLIRPDYGDNSLPLFGLIDEASKVNVNSASTAPTWNNPITTAVMRCASQSRRP